MKSVSYPVLLALGVVLLGFSACTDKGDEQESTSNYNNIDMLANYADNLILIGYADLDVKMKSLEDDVELFTTNPSVHLLIDARESLFAAQMSYQAVSSFEFGPATTNSLRSILSTYPVTESIIDDNIASGSYNLDAAKNVAAIGFAAMEYMLYDHQKTDQEVLDLFTSGANSADRKSYLTALIDQSVNTVSVVNSEWITGYSTVFKNADGSAVGSSVSLMLNAMVLDFERFIRDGKIGIPSGVRTLGVPNPEKVEAYYSANSLALVKQSISQYKTTFNGINGVGVDNAGFDDYLNHEGANATAKNINVQLDLILIKLDALSGPLSLDVVNNEDLVAEVYTEMQKAIVLLKVETPSALSILITYQDSDGD